MNNTTIALHRVSLAVIKVHVIIIMSDVLQSWLQEFSKGGPESVGLVASRSEVRAVMMWCPGNEKTKIYIIPNFSESSG